ncbi:hypothetical protein EON63_09230, partial [archaeon]
MQPSTKPSSQPTSQPTWLPSLKPSCQPSSMPTLQPTLQPTGQPSLQPTMQPFMQPSGQPSCQPSCQPTGQPTSYPTARPSLQPTFQPMSKPSDQPTAQPSMQPTLQPSGQPTSQPSIQPTGQPSWRLAAPTYLPSPTPTVMATFFPLLPGGGLNGNGTSAVNTSSAANVLSTLTGSAAEVVVVTDDVRLVSQVLPLATPGSSIAVTLPITEEEAALLTAGELVLPSISLVASSNSSGSVYVAVVVLASSLWVPPGRSSNSSTGNQTQPPPAELVGKLQSDVISVVTVGEGVSFVDIGFPAGTTAPLNATPAINFTIYCPPRYIVPKSFYCNDTGYVERVQCTGLASVVRGTCPRLLQTCAALDL